jgi:hypothetical protein
LKNNALEFSRRKNCPVLIQLLFRNDRGVI